MKSGILYSPELTRTSVQGTPGCSRPIFSWFVPRRDSQCIRNDTLCQPPQSPRVCQLPGHCRDGTPNHLDSKYPEDPIDPFPRKAPSPPRFPAILIDQLTIMQRNVSLNN